VKTTIVPMIISLYGGGFSCVASILASSSIFLSPGILSSSCLLCFSGSSSRDISLNFHFSNLLLL